MIYRLAFLTAHTSPLARPGRREAGGMNIYVGELARYISLLVCEQTHCGKTIVGRAAPQ